MPWAELHGVDKLDGKGEAKAEQDELPHVLCIFTYKEQTFDGHPFYTCGKKLEYFLPREV